MADRIVYGARTFDDDQLIEGNCYLACSLTSSALEIETFEFDVYSTDTSLIFFTQDAPLTYYADGRRIKTMYVQNVQRTGRFLYHFSAVSAAGVLDKHTHYGGICDGQTVQEVVADICGDFAVSVAPNIAKIKLYGWLPIASGRDNLSLVLFAISASLTEDDTGAIWVKGLEQTSKRQITEDQTMQDAKIDYRAPIRRVVVFEHQYVQNDSTEPEQLFEGTTADGDRITFSEPMHSLSATGFTIQSSGANYAIVSAGSGTLTGKPYIHAAREVVGRRSSMRVPVDEEADTIRVEEATLVSLVNSRAVADRLADYYACAERIVADVAYQADDAGDVLSQYHPYDGNMVQTCVESLDITLSGKLLAKMTSLVGYIPPDITQIEYYDTFEILTGSGTWTPPKGAKNARVVLIGGGDAGTNGTNGADGRGGHVTGHPELEGKGGEGGKAGTPGNGGKIFQSEIAANQSYQYNTGVGGKNGNKGTASTFGNMSSDNGTSSDIGFPNLIDRVTYALPGLPGADGAKGGNAESNGEDVEKWTGGLAGEGDSRDGYSGQGGGGSGAARGNNGNPGRDGNVDRYSTGNPNKPYGYLARGGSGGKGADATTAETRIEYGSGGNAGSGGGGGGGGGTANGSSDTESNEGRGGDGGLGSAGSAGRDGCIFVFYSLPRKEA